MATKTSLQNHYRELMHEWDRGALIHKASTTEDYFLEHVYDMLEQDNPDLGEITPAYYLDPMYGYHCVDGYAFSEQENSLTLVICDFCNDPQNLNEMKKAELDALFRHVKAFYKNARRQRFIDLDAGRAVSELVYLIANGDKSGHAGFQEKGGELTYLVITNKFVSPKLKEDFIKYNPEEEEKLPYTIRHEIVDFETISKRQPQPLKLDFTSFEGKEYSNGVPFIQVKMQDAVDFYESYILVIPAEALAQCYELFGTKLLEHNVRVYLQKKGKVNQGIHETIKKEPQAFFIYNNGLAVTADSLEFSNDGKRLTCINNPQVVNGGQTMACLHHAWKEKQDLSLITVQVKLTVVSSGIKGVIVPYISRYSNSQNAIKDTDQHSNDIVQIYFEQHSQKISIPGSIVCWYYERMRGQYANAQIHLSDGEKNKFRRYYPKDHVVRPEILAQAAMTYEMMPYLTARGAQKTYNGTGSIKGFCDYVAALWSVDPGYISSPQIYCDFISKLILYNKTASLVKRYILANHPQFSSFSASIAKYTLSLFIYLLSRKEMSVNLSKIWNLQNITVSLEDNLLRVAEFVLAQASQRIDHSEWLKKQSTWESIQERALSKNIYINTEDSSYTRSKPALMTERVQVRSSAKEDTTNQKFVMSQCPDRYWEELDTWATRLGGSAYTPNRQKLVQKRLKSQRLTDKQSEELIAYIQIAKRDGWQEPFAVGKLVEVPKPRIRSLSGNPIDTFLGTKDFDILILERTCDHQGGSIFLPDFFHRRPAVQEEELMRTVSAHPQLGEIRVFNIENGKKVVLAHTRLKSTSLPYLPILEVCLQNVAVQLPNQGDVKHKILMPHIYYESSDPQNLLGRRSIVGVVEKTLYMNDVTLMSLSLK